MATRLIVLVAALIYLGLGVCTFVPALNGGPNPGVEMDMGVMLHFTNLFWQFPMNYVSAVTFAMFGLTGLPAAATFRSAVLWSRVLFLFALGCLFAGVMPHPIGDAFGLMPMYSWSTALFLITALFMFYSAFFDGPMPEGALKPVFRQA